MSSDPAAGSQYSQRRTSGTAIASLVCGIASFFILPIIGAIAAIILGYNARKEIARDPQLDGEGYATAGIVLGWIGIALVILFILIFAIGTGSGGSGEGPYFSP